MYSIFGNSTHIVSWVDDSNRRGTQEILTSCIVTIFLCVWTALHLNVPHRADIRRLWCAKRQLWRKVGWLILTLLAPEMAMYTAWYQRREARRVKNLGIKVEKRVRDDDAHCHGDREEWGMKHAFYAIMGGFVIEIEGEESFLPNQRKRMTLTTKGIQYLAERFPTLLPNVSEEDIKDRSKAGGLGKSIVCIQAGWFITQCISRMAMALPITLLELNTLGHSVCALVIYLFWWNKPLDVEQPISIRGKQAESLLAYFWMTTDGLPVAYRKESKPKAEARYLGIPSAEEKQPPTGQTPIEPSDKRTAKSGKQLNRPSAWDQLSKILPTGQSLWRPYLAKRKAKDTEAKSTSIKLLKGQTLESTNIRNDSNDIILEQEDVRRWQTAEDLLRHHNNDNNNDWHRTITDRSRNWPSMDLDPKRIDWSLLLAFNSSGALYGGLHVLAWNAEFGTDLQRGLWRLASVFVVTFVPVSTIVLLVEKGMFMVVDARAGGVGHGVVEGFYKLLYRFNIWHICLALGVLAYIWARVYLVVECFVSLAHSPDEVYDLPQWSAYVPHIT